MKKIMMTLAAVCVAATMNAQVWVGGELGFSSSHTNGNDNSTKAFSITPEIGYNLDENFAVAIKLGYDYQEDFDFGEFIGLNGLTSLRTNAYTVNPYVRYTFLKAGNFSAFVDGGIHYTTMHAQGVDDNFNQFGVNVTPGISYAISEKVGLVAHLGKGLYWDHSWVKNTVRMNKFGLSLANAISFGAYYNF